METLLAPLKQSQQTAFGDPLVPIHEIVANRQIGLYLAGTLQAVFGHLDVPGPAREQLVCDVLNLARWSGREGLCAYETELHQVLSEAGIVSAIPRALAGRADLVWSQIRDVVAGSSVLDLGCGDGKVGAIAEGAGKSVQLCDVYRHSNIDPLALPFSLYSQNEPLPFRPESFDTVLVLTVLHHCDDPLGVLNEAVRVLAPGGRIVAIESVFGVHEATDSLSRKPEDAAFLALTSEQQRLGNIFFDHLYNRGVHYSCRAGEKVNVPFNFTTPENWDRTASLLGLTPHRFVALGIDQPIVPEFHTLHVWEKPI